MIYRYKSILRAGLFTAAGITASYTVASKIASPPCHRSFNRWGVLERQRSEKDKAFQTIMGITVVNMVVFLCWRIPSFEKKMYRYFASSIHSNVASVLLSVFSHRGPMHLAFNTVALFSFGQYLHEKMGREQFLAFYCSTGMLSSLGSLIYRRVKMDFSYSLGASGSLYGIIGSCAHDKNISVSPIFIPFLNLPLSQAFPALLLFDVMGIWRNWTRFDHAAHLCGAISGYIGYPLSQKYFWRLNKRFN